MAFGHTGDPCDRRSNRNRRFRESRGLVFLAGTAIARKAKRLWFKSCQECPSFAVTAFIRDFAASCGGWKIRCVRGREKRTMPEVQDKNSGYITI